MPIFETVAAHMPTPAHARTNVERDFKKSR
jgi:hypothetical protein